MCVVKFMDGIEEMVELLEERQGLSLNV